MARRRKNILLNLVTSLVFLTFLIFYAIPKFQHTVIDASQQMQNQSLQNSQNTLAKQKAAELTRLNKALTPIYVDKPHQGYTIRKAEIRTCAISMYGSELSTQRYNGEMG